MEKPSYTNGLNPIMQGWYSPHSEREQFVCNLHKACAGKDSARILEIGSFDGASALHFLENHAAKDCVVTCVDPWQDYAELEGQYKMAEIEAAFDANTYAARKELKILKHKVESVPFLADSVLSLRAGHRQQYDFIYVDGGHTAKHVLADGILAFELLKPGGVIAFDDYGWGLERHNPPHNRPREAVNALFDALRPYITGVIRGYRAFAQKL